jgi:hypothetical protein
MVLEAEFPATELINALNGFSGIVFQWNPPEKTYIIADNAFCNRLLHPSDVDMAKRYLQMATDHRSLRDALRNNSVTSCPYKGAFMAGIDSCFDRYDAHLNQLEKEWHSLPNQPISAFLSMFRYEDLISQLWKLWNKVNEGEMSYNSLITHVYRQRDAGSEEGRTCLDIVFHSLLTALYSDIWSWLMFGYLPEESTGTFFIREKGSDVQLEATDLPAIVDNVTALKILFTGHLIRYITSFPNSPHVFCDKEYEFARNFKELRSKPFDKQSFCDFVESVRWEAAKFSSNYVIQEELIVQHFTSIKQIFLTGHENLWIFFIDKIRELSQRRCDTWSKVRRDKYIRTAIESILLKLYCNDEEADAFLSNLNFSFRFDSNSVLPIIQIDYALPPLTQRIIQSHLMDKYQRIFNFMLHLFLARQQLSCAWSRHMRKRVSGGQRDCKKKRERSSMWFIRHKLIHFINHLSFYLKVNVFETQMVEFLNEVRVSEDYEAMQLRHASFVSTMMREMFLDYPAVERILLRIFAFVHKLFSETSAEPSEEEVRKYDADLSKMLHELELLFCALRDLRFHNSLCQLLLKMKMGSES